MNVNLDKSTLSEVWDFISQTNAFENYVVDPVFEEEVGDIEFEQFFCIHSQCTSQVHVQ